VRALHRSEAERRVQGSGNIRERDAVAEMSLRLIAIGLTLGVLIYLFANGGGY
jgi:hypothetical protein